MTASFTTFARTSGYAAGLALLLATVACGGSPTNPSVGLDVPFSATDVTVGTGVEAKLGDTLAVEYGGWLYDPDGQDNKGTLFDTSYYYPTQFQFVLTTGAVIPGWLQGLPGMRVGGTRRLVIPPDLAYGAGGNGNIPGDATLVFDIELAGVVPVTAQ